MSTLCTALHTHDFLWGLFMRIDGECCSITPASGKLLHVRFLVDCQWGTLDSTVSAGLDWSWPWVSHLISLSEKWFQKLKSEIWGQRFADGAFSSPQTESRRHQRLGLYRGQGGEAQGRSDWFHKHWGTTERFGGRRDLFYYIRNENSSDPTSNEHICIFSEDMMQGFHWNVAAWRYFRVLFHRLVLSFPKKLKLSLLKFLPAKLVGTDTGLGKRSCLVCISLTLF